jgi:hypothetical protein
MYLLIELEARKEGAALKTRHPRDDKEIWRVHEVVKSLWGPHSSGI